MTSTTPPGIVRFGPRAAAGMPAALKRVPADAAQRDRLRQAGLKAASELTGAAGPARELLRELARRLLDRLEMPAEYLGFAMVMLANGWWLERLRRVPPARRLLLLPRCLRGAADGPDTREPTPASLRRQAEALGYRTLIADGTPPVVQALAAGGIDGIVGVSCLDSLEAVFDKIAALGVPAVAVPLLEGTCRDTRADLHWLQEYLQDHLPVVAAPAADRSIWLRLLQHAAGVFEPDRLAALLAPAEPARHGGALDQTGQAARTWLVAGGKRLRPFVTLATATTLKGLTDPDELPTAARRVAVAIEAFHKASLAHDDIEDDDEQRYGRPTLHRRIGRAPAINVGDYLLGLGYRLLSAAGRELPEGVGPAIMAQMSRAHVLLAQGQGAELAWRGHDAPLPPPAEVLRAYALKTAPAFAAALNCGVLLGAGAAESPAALETFCRHVGVGFQVLNDLADWRDDLVAGRLTYLAALAGQAEPDEAARSQLLSAVRAADGSEAALQATAERIAARGAFADAEALVERLRGRASGLAGRMDPRPLGALCEFLVDLILS